MGQTIELPDVIASAIEVALQGVWTAIPGRIESYDTETQTAGIQITIKSGSISENGDRKAETIAPLTSVPVLHLGGGAFRTVYPITRGDTCLVVFTSRSISEWLNLGGIVDPGFDHHHNLSDAVALVGLRDYKHALGNVPTDRMSIGKDSGPSIEITSSEVRVGGNTGLQPTFKGNAHNTAMNTLITAISSAFGSLPGGIGAGAASAVASALLTFLVDVDLALTTVAKVK